eukprot:g2330.t1
MSFLYREAGRVLQGVEDGKASLKTLTLGRANSVGGGKGGDQNGPKRKLYAMVSETLRYKPLLDRLVVKADPKGTLFSEEHMREKAQGYIMLYEMLLGKGSIQGGGKLKRHLMQYKARLEECLVSAKLAEGLQPDASNESLLPKSARRHIFPRYARVNLMACAGGAKAVAARLQKEGFAAKVDSVVPSLLVLPPGTDLHDHAMVKDGTLVLQDKSSCFSAEALLGEEACAGAAASRGPGANEWRGGDVIDACAAPGNKTMHAASLLHRHQRAALERGNGSGIVSAPDRLHENQEEDSGGGTADEEGAGAGGTARVARLAAFQLQSLLKAMSFPQVQRVCYSTCSVHVEENEDVVAKALDQQEPSHPPPTTTSTATTATAAAAATCPERFELSRCLSRWPRRGQVVAGLTEAQAACLVRTDPSRDETNGFFVAVFERGRGSGGGGSGGGRGGGVREEGEEASTGGAVEGGGEAAAAKRRRKNRKKKDNRKKRKREGAEPQAEPQAVAEQDPAEGDAGVAEGELQPTAAPENVANGGVGARGRVVAPG